MSDLSVRARNEIYSDMDFAFRANSITGDISKKRDIEAIKQSVLNILMTNRGERPFMPVFGGNINSYLFELAGPETNALIEQEIINAIKNYEPRVRILEVVVSDYSERNAIHILLEMEILSPNLGTQSVEFIVERLR